jgi:tripartite-type tricarboxylate transporter receptor subunit TctC
MKIFKRRSLVYVIAAVLCPLAVTAQDYPAKPITIVVPFSAGGGVDAVARLLAEKLRTGFNQAVLVDNKPGASGMLGASFVAKSAPDGYTLLLGSAGETAINPFVYKAKMQYTPEKDFVPITLVTRVPNVLVANNNFPVKNVAELVAYAKKNPGKVTYATSGVGNPQHLNGELLQSLTGIQMTHVPYKGASNQLVDVASGTVDITFVSLAGAASFIKGNRVKALAVTSAKRASFAPDVPTIAEFAPAASYNLDNWFGLFAPAATPQAIQNKLNAVVSEALRDPELIKKLEAQGGDAAPMSQKQFKDFIAVEKTKYQKIVDAAHITAE